MRKKILVILLTITMMSVFLCGCEQNNNSVNADTSELTTEQMEDALGTKAEHKGGNTYAVYGGVVTLCAYKGMDLKKYTYKMTDEYMKSQAESYMKGNTYYEKVTGEIETGDYLECKMTVTVDGNPVEDYTGDNISLSVGESEFGEQFDNTLIGKIVGATGAETISYDKDYNVSEFAGRTINIEYTINSAERYVEPELTKENVKEIYHLESIDAYYEYVKKLMEKGYKDKTKSMYGSQIFTYLLDNCKFKSYNKDLLERYVAESLESYESYKDIVGAETIEQTMEMLGVSEDDIRETNKKYIYEEMLTYAIATKEGIIVTDEEIDEKITEFAESAGYESEEDFLKDYSRHLIRYWVYYDKVIDLIVDNANLEEIVQYDENPFATE